MSMSTLPPPLEFTTPAQMDGYAAAWQDRREYFEGTASEMHIPEPRTCAPTVRAPAALPPPPSFVFPKFPKPAKLPAIPAWLVYTPNDGSP